MALNQNSLTTVENLRIQLEIAPADVDAAMTAKLEKLINAASSAIEGIAKRSLKINTHTEFADGDRSTLFIPKEWPIVSVNELWIDNSSEFTYLSSQLDSYEFAIVDDNTAIQLTKGRVFPFGNYNIKVVYQAGYSTVPSDLELAADLYCEWLFRFNERRDIGRTSKAKGDESVSMLQQIPDQIRLLIEPYIRLEIPNPRSVRTV